MQLNGTGFFQKWVAFFTAQNEIINLNGQKNIAYKISANLEVNIYLIQSAKHYHNNLLKVYYNYDQNW